MDEFRLALRSLPSLSMMIEICRITQFQGRSSSVTESSYQGNFLLKEN